MAADAWQMPARRCNAKLVLSPPSPAASVRAGMRQSMPSSSIDNCAGVSDTTPSLACGQTKRPRSSRLASSTSPGRPTTAP